MSPAFRKYRNSPAGALYFIFYPARIPVTGYSAITILHEISIPYFLLNDKKISINYFLKSVDNLENLYYTCKAIAICASVSGILAQLGEHLPYKQRVTGSSPVGPTF